jgi:predicted Rossmann-fold nucleotide-binding protein
MKQLAAELTSMGCDIDSGGGSGLMQAANEAAHWVDPQGLRRSVGINIASEARAIPRNAARVAIPLNDAEH